jgi:hypothetical protein
LVKRGYVSLAGVGIIAVEGVMIMQTAYVVTGTLNADQTVTLDEALPLEPMKMRLAVEPLRPKQTRSHKEVITEIRQRQKARGYVPPTREEVDAYIQAERDSWDD